MTQPKRPRKPAASRRPVQAKGGGRVALALAPDGAVSGAESARRERLGAEGAADVGFEERVRAWAELRALAFKPALGRKIAAEGAPGLEGRVPSPDHYATMLRTFRERTRRKDGPSIAPGPPDPAQPSNWIPIGPSVVRRGQAVGNPAVSGRTADVAIAPGGTRVYAATANGGVWRSDDGGTHWRSLLDNWDLDPTTPGVDSQACGAIAIDPLGPDRVYVGTGEGEAAIFFGGVFGVVFSYAGVGPLRTDDGGTTWINEPVAAGSPSLNGQAFYNLVLDPADRERVVAATTAGIYRREPDGAGGYRWRQTRAGTCTSVAVARSGGVTTFFAAMYGGPVFSSPDGSTWTALGAYPGATSRVSLAVQTTNPTVVYALSAGALQRYDASDGQWRAVSGAPPGVGLSDYKMSIAVDPADATRLYFGGTSLARGIVSSSGAGPTLAYSLAVTSIGGDVHPDIHRLVVRQDASSEVWVATDGGVFRTTDGPGAAAFAPRNTGLSTMTCTYLDHHPTEAAVIFCGAQDNGTLRYTGEEAWLHSADGDGGANVVNWNDPYKVIRSYIYGTLYRTTDGGESTGSWSYISPGASGALFYPPLVGTPRNVASPADAEIIAMGASRTWFSPNFGTNWSTPDTADLNGTVSALVFRSATELYAGTTSGRVYRYTRTGTTWGAGTLIGQVGGGAAGLAPIVTDIVVDPTNASAFYACLGGIGDWRRIWRYDGTNWTARSGPSAGSASSVLPVHFNALVVDPANPQQLFAGADIGIWRSADGGANWSPYQNGLPDAGVVDMQLHADRRLLRVATYGRGVYERAIDATTSPAVELYVRDTELDLGRWPTVDWLANPEVPNGKVRHWAGPNIKVDPPSSAGTYQTPTTAIDFLQFAELVDGSEGVATRDPATGTVVNRVYVEVHNRGIQAANGVQVMLLLSNASAGLPALPAGYTANVQSGTPITSAAWKTVGIRTINGLAVGVPQIAEFDLPSSMLPPPASLPGQSHFCALALLHSTDDNFTSTQTNVDALGVNERKAAHKNLHIVPYTGPASPGEPITVALDLNGGTRSTDLLLDLGAFRGELTLVLPKDFGGTGFEGKVDGGRVLPRGKVDAQVRAHVATLKRMVAESRCDAEWGQAALERARQFAGAAAVRFEADGDRRIVGLRELTPRKGSVPALLILHPPRDAQLGDVFEFDVIEVDAKRQRVLGGSTYVCRMTLPPDDTQEIELETRFEHPARGGVVRLLVRPTARDEPLAEGDVEIDAVLFTPAGVNPAPERLKWDKRKQVFVLDLSRDPGASLVRRLTLIARAGEREARRTVDVPAAD
jgi:hypothetical protein